MTANQSGRSAHPTRQLLAWAATVLVLAGCGTPKEAKQEGPAKSPAKQPSQDPLAGSAKQPSDAASGNPAQQPSVAEAEDPVTEPVRIEITAAWPGASPVDIEELLVYPVEMAVASLARLKTTRADILQSVAKITLTLEDGADADDRLLAVTRCTAGTRQTPLWGRRIPAADPSSSASSPSLDCLDVAATSQATVVDQDARAQGSNHPYTACRRSSCLRHTTVVLGSGCG